MKNINFLFEFSSFKLFLQEADYLWIFNISSVLHIILIPVNACLI